jgi:hypothetical protein
VTDLPLDDPVVASLLDGPNLARLAYSGLDGRPRVVPIWFTLLNGDIVMVTGPRASKVRALEADNAVALTIDDARPPYKVLLVEGNASLEPSKGSRPSTRPSPAAISALSRTLTYLSSGSSVRYASASTHAHIASSTSSSAIRRACVRRRQIGR